MKMVSRILYGALLFLVASVTDAESPTELYNKGNEAYRNKDWESAIENYELAVNEGAISHSLFYNLGCAYFRQGNIGKAILWFERARLLAPRDRDILRNLAFARTRTLDKIESVYSGTPLQFLWSFLESISFGEFKWILLFISVIATIATIYWILQLRRKWLAIFLWVLFIMFGILFYIKGHRLWETSLAIVVEQRISVRSSPSEDGELLFALNSGTRVGILEKRGDWYRIILEDGNSGWANMQGIEPVMIHWRSKW